MGKGISLPNQERVALPTPTVGGEPLEVPELDEVRSDVDRMNALILAGKDPKRASEILNRARGRGKDKQQNMEKALQKNKTIVERNREMFAKVGMKKTEPYRVLFDIMTNATKTVPFTEPDHNGVLRTRYEQVPDYTARLSACRQVTLLQGMDPRAEMRINILNQAGGGQIAQVQIGEAYITIANMTDDAARLAAYNEFQRNQKSGNFKVIDEGQVVEGSYTEAAPIGAGG